MDHKDTLSLSESIYFLGREIGQLRHQKEIEFEVLKSHFGLATKHDLKELENKIMSAISDFAAKQTAFQDRVDAAITGLSGDIDELKAEILKLQNSPGTITPEDQALLDGIQSRTEGVATKLEALDALTPPVPPTA